MEMPGDLALAVCSGGDKVQQFAADWGIRGRFEYQRHRINLRRQCFGKHGYALWQAFQSEGDSAIQIRAFHRNQSGKAIPTRDADALPGLGVVTGDLWDFDIDLRLGRCHFDSVSEIRSAFAERVADANE